MADSRISLDELAAEEEELQFSSFTHDDAWDLGCALIASARRENLPVAVDITRNRQQLFHATRPGTAPDNDWWIRRKTRVVDKFGHSSLYVREASLARGTTFEEEFGLDPNRYAAHGGAFPVIVRSVGPVGVVVVSGLPQIDDHRMVVAAIRAHLAG
jgi:uncharacterized protein (UPF0303 family)